MNIEYLLLTFYGGLVFYFTFKYISQTQTFEFQEYPNFISIIVAYRNEADNLHNLLKDLLVQENSVGYEIILVNDHSTDQSLEIVENHKNEKIRSLSLPSEKQGKKEALRLAASMARGEILLFTDADCRIKPKWLKIMCMPFRNQSTSMVAGPFLYYFENHIIGFFQHIEQTLLWGFTKSMATMGFPVLCNGANLAIKKNLYLSLTDKIYDKGPSGDDIFLLQEVKKIDPKGIVYMEHPETVTHSIPTNDFRLFLNQKIRWASKSGKLTDWAMKVAGSLFFIINIYFLVQLFSGSFRTFLIKTALELFFLYTIYTFQFGKFKSIWATGLFLLKSFCILAFYPIYGFFIALFAKTIRFEWKQRVYS